MPRVKLTFTRQRTIETTAPIRNETMTLDEVKQRIDRGEVVTDIGQIDKRTRAWLNREAKADRLVKWLDRNWPRPKNAYHRSALQADPDYFTGKE